MPKLHSLVLACLVLLALPAGAAARAGDLDPGFAGGSALLIGRAGVPVAGSALALQSDGRVTVWTDDYSSLVGLFRTH